MKRTILIATIALAFMVPALPAHAFLGLGGCAASGAGGAGAGAAAKATSVPVSNAILENNSTSLTTKECVLDGLTSILSQALISSITDNIVSWINSGFEGGPAYVTNLNGLLGQIADNTTLDFLQGSELGLLCSPFRLPVIQAVLGDYQSQQNFSQRVSCSLGSVTNNIEGFLGGDFSQGGWQGLFELARNEQNNPIAVTLSTKDELASRIVSKQNEQVAYLNFGNGFFSKGKCTVSSANFIGPTQPGTQADGRAQVNIDTEAGCSAAGGKWNIVTPGSQVNSQLSKWLGVSADKLAAADEIDEIINAVLAQLSQQLFTSLDGLRGLSSNDSASAARGQSYLQQLTDTADANTIASARTIIIDDINTAINYEESYRGIVDQIIAAYTSVQTKYTALKSCAQKAGLSSLQASTDNTLSAVTYNLSDYTAQRDQSVNTVAELIVIRSHAQAAATAAKVNAVADEYDSFLNQGLVHTNIVFIAQELDSLQTNTIPQYNKEIAAGLQQCGG